MGFSIELDSPIYPQVRSVEDTRAGRRLDTIIRKNSSTYLNYLKRFEGLAPLVKSVALDGDLNGRAPFWNQGWLPTLDALSICGMLLEHKPRRYIEVGSGNSTKFARATIDHFGLRTTITSIDPYPRAEIDGLCDVVMRQRCEEVSPEFFESIESADLLFVDNSHYAFQNSDVTVFFTEILPALPGGTIYGLHDIFLPYDYPPQFVDRYYNEQYILAAYLFGGGGKDEILLPNAFVTRDPAFQAAKAALWALLQLPEKLTAFPPGLPYEGCFWACKA